MPKADYWQLSVGDNSSNTPEEYQDYLMFDPAPYSAANGVWVALKRLTWQWGLTYSNPTSPNGVWTASGQQTFNPPNEIIYGAVGDKGVSAVSVWPAWDAQLLDIKNWVRIN